MRDSGAPGRTRTADPLITNLKVFVILRYADIPKVSKNIIKSVYKMDIGSLRFLKIPLDVLTMCLLRVKKQAREQNGKYHKTFG